MTTLLMRKKLLFGIFAISALFGCEEQQDPQPLAETSEFNFRYDTYPKVENFELILTQNDGRVLLDTLLSSHTNHSIKVKSADTKFNITTLFFNQGTGWYDIKTYTQVNPNNWYINNSRTTTNEQREETKITYTNVPSYDSNFNFSSLNLSSWGSFWSGNLGIVNFEKLLPSDKAYIIFPSYGKYILTDIATAPYTADFSEAKNTVKTQYNKPAGITYFRASLYGYPSGGLPNQRLRLFGGRALPTSEYDLQYPPTGFDLYDCNLYYLDSEKNLHFYIYKGISAVPTDPEFLEKADFVANRVEFEDFQIAFNANKPSVYSTLWFSADTTKLKANWEVYAAPENNSFKPKAFFEKLNTKTFSDKSLPAFKLTTVVSKKAKGHDYQTYLDHMLNETIRKNDPIKHYREITKYF
jgi:hypothetical protein